MRTFLQATAVALLLFSAALAAEEKPLRALIVDGQNNHGAWPKTTFMMKHYLEETGLFTVDIQRTRFTWQGENHLPNYPLPNFPTRSLPKSKTDEQFKPDFTKYDVVVNNFGYNCAPWPEQTKRAFEQYMQGGGGLVSVHAADNCWPDWPAYNNMIGLGGWGGRDQRAGPYVYYDDQAKLVRDASDGKGGGHGPQSAFEIVARNTDHPITRGLPANWLHAKDELYDKLRGPAENMTVLATAYSSTNRRGTGRHEPMLMTIEYGKGRVFHSTLGHEDYSMECVGFITTFQRGTEWAATGEVTQEVPADFPGVEEPSIRRFEDGSTSPESS